MHRARSRDEAAHSQGGRRCHHDDILRVGGVLSRLGRSRIDVGTRMASDFFERQDIARRNTSRLVFLFVLAVPAIIVSVDLLLAAVFGYLGRDLETGAMDLALAFDPGVMAVAVIGTLLVVVGGSTYKVMELWGGGRVVAEQLGGRLLNQNSAVPYERRLLNVVEEMAVASGTPAPPVYLLEHEQGINAFAAGFTPSDAVLGVTRGTAERLSRDELQGVIAHEFSHILNGDMRLNIRLIGLLHGILIIGLIGYFLFRVAAFSGMGRRRDRQGNQLPLIAFGAGLMFIGFFGSFFGGMIKAAVSRQREFLADASAVQFTRNPEGIVCALKKIGGFLTGSKIENPNAPQASHMFFGLATSGFTSLFATHPPLGERIRRLEPSWDGEFLESAPTGGPGVAPPLEAAGLAGFAGATPAGAGTEPSLSQAVDKIGQPTTQHLDYAARLIDRLPTPLIEAAHEPYSARAVVYGLLIDPQADIRRVQLARLSTAGDQGVFDEMMRLLPMVERLDRRARLPLVEISAATLRALTRAQYERFKQNIAELVLADNRIGLFEWSLQRILLHDLEGQFGQVPSPRVRYKTLARLVPQCEAVLSTLAHVGHHEPTAVEHAFALGWQQLGLPEAGPRALEESGLEVLDVALVELEAAAPSLKRRVLQAAAACIAADLAVTANEVELLRAMSAALGCPMPPLLATGH